MTIACLTAREPVQLVKDCEPETHEAVRFRHIVDEHVDFIWRSLRRLGIRQGDLADAAQQVFLVAAHKLSQISAGSERQFLFQTALRVASTTRRWRRRRREVSDESLLEMPDGSTTADDQLDARYQRRLLDRALDAMPLELRAPFILIEVEELTMAQAAALLMIPAGTVASRLRRARARFHREVRILRNREGV